MSVWFEGEDEIRANLHHVQQSVENLAEHFAEITRLMPGLSNVEVIEQGSNWVTIKTNEGSMVRTNIASHADAERVVVEFDEKYQAGSRITTTSRFSHSFTTSDTGVTHRLVITDVEAPGFLGFFYRRFGADKTGNAFLRAYKAAFEERAG